MKIHLMKRLIDENNYRFLFRCQSRGGLKVVTMLLGVDAGGTSTRAVVVDESGRCLGYGTAGGGNPIARGPVQAGRAIIEAATGAVRAARAASHDPDGVQLSGPAVLAMAGASAFFLPGVMTSDLRTIGDFDRVEVMSDVLGTFCSGTPKDSGYTLVAGTGTAAVRVEHGEIAATVDGLGWLLGDAGSGFWIGQRVVRAALAALTDHGPDTVMAPMLQEDLGLEIGQRRGPTGRLLGLDAAVKQLYQMQPVELSRFASMAFRAAGVPEATGQPEAAREPEATGAASWDFPADADPVAVTILTKARARLIGTVAAARTDSLPGPVVVGGTVAQRMPGLAAGIRDRFSHAGGPPPQIAMVPDGAIGAAVLTLREAGVRVDDAVFGRLVTSVNEWRNDDQAR